MMHTRCPALCVAVHLALGAVAPGCAWAEAVYKSVDADGKITYSSTPPPAGSAREVEELQILPGPTSAEEDAAARRERALEGVEQKRENERAATEKRRGAAIAAAQQDLIRAKADLEQAKIQGDGDWQYLVSGGRVLSGSYFERIADAEAKVEAAEKALQRTRQGR
jgi:hypothetical protein